MNALETISIGLVGILPHLATGLLLLFAYRLIHDWITPFNDKEQLQGGNIAASLSRGGAYLGILIAQVGSLFHKEGNYWLELGMFVADGVIATVMFTVAAYVLDYFILRKVNNYEQLAAGNKAAGVVECCGYVSLGIIMAAAFTGGGQEFWPGIGSAALFSAVGLMTVVTIYALYGLWWKRRAQCWIDEEVGRGNLAAAIDAGLLMVAMSITLAFSISGDFTGWFDDIVSYAVAAVSSVVAVSIGRTASALLLAHGASKTKSGTHHSNSAKATITGLATIGAAFIAGVVTFV